jgi:APA family basic amino acid/polyamine antiporter
VVVVVAYLSINLTYLRLLGFDAASKSATIAADACRVALQPFGAGEQGARVMAAAIAISALGIMNTILLAPPWVLHVMARRGLFLPACGRLHPRLGSPVVGVLVQGVWAMVILIAAHLTFGQNGRGTLDTLGAVLTGVVFVDWLFYALCGLALIALARRRGVALLWRSSPLVAGLFAAAAAVVMIGAIATDPVPSLVGAGLCALGVVPFLYFQRRR